MSAKNRIGFGVRAFEKLGVQMRQDPHRAFTTFVAIAACAVSGGNREPEYMNLIKDIEAPALSMMGELLVELVESMERDPFTDVLGPIHMETGSKGGQAFGGEFYTPRDVCRMMAQVTVNPKDVPVDRPYRILEPACGAGQMVLSTIEALVDGGVSPRQVEATCVDVSRLACDMCFINLTLWGVPAVVIHGNTLSGEQWGSWPTIHWHMTRPLARLACAAEAARELLELERSPVPTIQDVAAELDKRGQWTMNFEEVTA